tara:strand:+ start:645 stop:1007 length:363 start_codon:yes stop_codon:yes gene_type:complete
MKISYWDAVLNLVNNTEISGPVDGPITEYTFHNNQTPPTEEEIQSKLAELQAEEPMRLLKEERNQRLSETDWRDLPSYPGTDQDAWRTYRQALRDLPSTASPTLDDNGQLTNVTWPTKPT